METIGFKPMLFKDTNGNVIGLADTLYILDFKKMISKLLMDQGYKVEEWTKSYFLVVKEFQADAD